MSEIPQDLIDKMMVKCARRCCICRRFRPTKLQVHHIVERSEGGTNDEDNLIVTCLSCHTDVHTKVPFTRRFSVDELKGHRDTVVRLVAEGGLPLDDTDDADEVIANVVRTMQAVSSPRLSLLPEAVEMLLAAVNTNSNRQGLVVTSNTNMGRNYYPGDRQGLVARGDRRSEAKYKHATRQLVECGLLEQTSEALLEVTYDGYLAADELLAAGPQLLAHSGQQD